MSTRSSSSDAIAATAIRHSKRNTRYAVTSARKITRPCSALLVTWPPQEVLTALSLIWSGRCRSVSATFSLISVSPGRVGDQLAS